MVLRKESHLIGVSSVNGKESKFCNTIWVRQSSLEAKESEHIPCPRVQECAELVSLFGASRWLDSVHPSLAVLQCFSDKAGLWGQYSSLRSQWNPDSEQHCTPRNDSATNQSENQQPVLQIHSIFIILPHIYFTHLILSQGRPVNHPRGNGGLG